MAQDVRENVRPEDLEGFRGQHGCVDEIRVVMAAARQRNDAIGHVLMAGPPGLGKTTMARIIAREMGSPFVSAMASGLAKPEDLNLLLGKLPSDGYDERGRIVDRSKVRFGVLFLDEVERLKKDLMELLHSALEDFVVTLRNKRPDGTARADLYWIPKFTMVAATNYAGQLPRPFLDRFKTRLNFEAYDDGTMQQIVVDMAARQGLRIDPKAAAAIAARSRGTPRTALAFLEKSRDMTYFVGRGGDTVDEESVRRMFETTRIDELGLGDLDRKVLAYLAKVSMPMGLDAVAQGVDDDVSTIERVCEPWLVKLGLVVRTKSGRAITLAGMRHIGVNMKNEGLKPVEEPTW